MRTALIVTLSVFFVMLCRTTAEESPHRLAVQIIAASAPVSAYVPKDNSDAEKKRAAINLRLRNFMLSDAVPEDVRVCYALGIVERQMLDVHNLPSDSAKAAREELLQEHRTLEAYLRQLSEPAK
jgi:hypothetical protein